jgi:N4-(beta-N-acetylglucosaminyl)-L-asparaginase
MDPEDQSVGYGGLPNEEGIVELDASVMSGPSHKCGSVASLRNIKKACSVARVIMERSDHIMLVGDGARRFAIAHGFKEEDLLTEKSRIDWLKWKESLNDKDDWLPPPDNDYSKESKERSTGTINVLGIDDKGNAFSITTTSGLAFKIPGRVGDSPIIGAGLYVDNEVGAAGATGRGEEVIRTCGSFLVVEKMAAGVSPQKACEFACRRILDVNKGKADFNVKFIAVNKKGQVGCSQIHKGKGAQCSFINPDGFTAIESGFLME